jgi:hypothetical protein
MRSFNKLIMTVCAVACLLACGIASGQEPIRKVVRKIVGYDRVCRGNFCEMVPRYADVEVYELPIDEPPAAPPAAYTAPACDVQPQAQAFRLQEQSATKVTELEPPATWSTPRVFANQPVRSFLSSRPVRSFLAARPLRTFLGRLFRR